MAQTTELEAVNQMLSAVGEAPVVSLAVAVPEVEMAKLVLARVSREVQAGSWYFNSDTGYPLAPGTNGEITVPSNALRVDASDDRHSITVRAGKLYDRTQHSTAFTEAVPCDITWLFPFAELPEPACQYIALRAARRFQREYLGSETLDKLSDEDEKTAYINLLDFDGEGADFNLLEGDPETLRRTLRVL